MLITACNKDGDGPSIDLFRSLIDSMGQIRIDGKALVGVNLISEKYKTPYMKLTLIDTGKRKPAKR